MGPRQRRRHLSRRYPHAAAVLGAGLPGAELRPGPRGRPRRPPGPDLHASTDRFDFFEAQGPVSETFDLVVGDRTAPRAAWRRDDPALGDRIVLTWRPGAIDWREEDETVAGHPRDPHSRVEALASSRHVVVSADGTTLADSRSPVLLFETTLPTRFYLPEADLAPGVLALSSTRSHCPYKGFADRYWSVRDRPDLRDIAWSYARPYPAVGATAGRVAFYDEVLDITVDGVRLDRPSSPFSHREQRPGTD